MYRFLEQDLISNMSRCGNGLRRGLVGPCGDFDEKMHVQFFFDVPNFPLQKNCSCVGTGY